MILDNLIPVKRCVIFTFNKGDVARNTGLDSLWGVLGSITPGFYLSVEHNGDLLLLDWPAAAQTARDSRPSALVWVLPCFVSPLPTLGYLPRLPLCSPWHAFSFYTWDNQLQCVCVFVCVLAFWGFFFGEGVLLWGRACLVFISLGRLWMGQCCLLACLVFISLRCLWMGQCCLPARSFCGSGNHVSISDSGLLNWGGGVIY